MTRHALLLAGLLLLGCDDSSPGSDGGMDSGIDAGSEDLDAAGSDAASVDASTLDATASDAATGDAGIDCSTIGCGAPVFCGEPCDAPCGCCPCGTESFCMDDDLVSCSAGCYERRPCGAGACVDGSGGATCGDDRCDTIEAEYEALIGPSGMACSAAGACQVLDGHCGVGLGGCYHPVNNGVTQAQLDELARRWSVLRCDIGRPVCDCPIRPTTVRCEAGACVTG